MFAKVYAFFLLLLFFTPANTFAQPNSIFFDRISTENGLVSNSVFAVLKDKDGILWIGTAEGLSRYDGSGFTNYYHRKNDSSTLKNNNVSALMQDKENRIWIGANDVVSYLDPYTQKITNIDFPYTVATTPGGVSSMVQNPYDGRTWITTHRGLFIADTKNNKLVPVIDKDSLFIKAGLSDIIFENKNYAWISSRYGLLKFDMDKKTVKLFAPPGRAPVPENKNQNVLTAIAKGDGNTLWVGNWGAGLQQFDIATEKFTMYLPEPKLGVRGDANIVLDIMPSQYPDEKNVLWLATGSTGFTMFNTTTKNFSFYNRSDNGKKYFTPPGVYALCYATGEGLWMGSTDGLYRYDRHLQTFQFASFKDKTAGRHCLPEVMNVYADPADTSGKTFWVSTWTCGNYMYNASTGAFTSLPAWMNKWIKQGDIIDIAYRDRQNRLWINLNDKQLFAVDEKHTVFHPVYYYNKQLQQQIPVVAQSMMEDRVGNTWLGGVHGLYRVSRNSSEVTPISTTGTAVPKGTSVLVTSITEDKAGRVWFGGRADGYNGKAAIGMVDPHTLQVTYYTTDNKPALPGAYYFNGLSYVASNNTVWAGSNKGLVCWKAADVPEFITLTRADGICSDNINKIAKDKQDNIWAATVNGVSYCDTQGHFHNFYTEQGLAENEVRRIFSNTVTGEIILGFPEKLCTVNAQILKTALAPPPVIISALQVFNEPYLQNGQPFYPDKKKVALSYTENNITLSFSALSYTTPQQNRYAYKMEGLDKAWIYTGSNSVTYSQLPPGNYTFRTKACNSMGVWNEEGTYLDIHVAAPFYRTAWFIIGCILLAAYLIYLVYRYRVAQLKKMYGIRNDIARDLHDEIGSTLTSINILSKVSELNLEKDKEATLKHLKQISEQSQNMQQSMSDIVWAIKPDEDKVGNMTERMLEYVTHVLEIKNVNVTFDVDEALLQVVLQMQQRRDFFMLFKEAVNNIAKHAGAKNVSIKLSRQHRQIVLCIKDDGAGFDELTSKFSNGLKNMRRRAAEMGGNIVIESQVNKGTAITLSIPQL